MGLKPDEVFPSQESPATPLESWYTPAPLTQSILDPGEPNPEGRREAITNAFASVALCFGWIPPPSQMPSLASSLCFFPWRPLGIQPQVGTRGQLPAELISCQLAE